MSGRRLNVFTWHIHGTYLFYLSQGNFDLCIPVRGDRKEEGYYGRGETFPFGSNVREVPVEELEEMQFDCILFQTNKNYLVDQYEILSEQQRALPKVYVEHDPPRMHPTDTKHVVKDPDVLLVHVTYFNKLMWDNNGVPARVIEHGVPESTVPYSGQLERGLVVINNLPSRGRLLGLDIFLEVRKQVPLDLIGMNTGDLGLGEVLHPRLPAFTSQYRFFFNPIRYTSLGLAVCEAMMAGIPVVGMATTELSAVIQNGHNGYIHTDINYLIEQMQLLLHNKEAAVAIGLNGQKTAQQRFDIQRFTTDWERVFRSAIQMRPANTGVLSP